MTKDKDVKMEEPKLTKKDSPSKPSVAELAGRFKGHILPMPSSSEELPFRRRPPCSLRLQNQADDNEESDKTFSPSSIKTKKNSAIFEKLEANLSLSPTGLLPSPKSPDVKLQPAPLSPTTPCSPLSPTVRLPHLSSEDEDPISFDSPPEGTPLPSFNKTRARLSFKRRPPTRQHRRSTGEEAGAAGSDLSPCELHAPNENGDKEEVFQNLTEEAEFEELASLKEIENKDEDCVKIEADATQSDPDSRGKPQQEVQQDKCAEPLEEEQKPFQSSEQMEDDVKTKERKIPQEAHNDGL